MFALAGHLGMTVAELGERMSSSELSEWIAMLGIEPWGPYRLDILNAISAYASAAPWCKNTKVGDWLPKFNQSSQPADREALLAYLKATGGRVNGHNQPAGDQPGLERQGG
jgi:hypothetical protein